MLEQKFSRGFIRIGKMTCGNCPTQWDCTLPDGAAGFIHYRSGELNVYDGALASIAHTDNFDTPQVTLEEVTSWLLQEGFEVGTV